MSKGTTYLIGKIGTLACIASVVCGVTGIGIWSNKADIILKVAFVIFGIGLSLVLCPFLFGHVPRKKTGNLDFPYYPPRY